MAMLLLPNAEPSDPSRVSAYRRAVALAEHFALAAWTLADSLPSTPTEEPSDELHRYAIEAAKRERVPDSNPETHDEEVGGIIRSVDEGWSKVWHAQDLDHYLDQVVLDAVEVGAAHNAELGKRHFALLFPADKLPSPEFEDAVKAWADDNGKWKAATRLLDRFSGPHKVDAVTKARCRWVKRLRKLRGE